MKASSHDSGDVLRPDLYAAVAGARRTEFIARREVLPVAPHRSPSGDAPARLRLCYLVPRTDICGGTRVQFEQANRMAARGHRVTVLSHYRQPDWFDLRVPFMQVPWGLELAEAVPACDPACDLVVAGAWDQIMAARVLGTAPVVHFEQGDLHLFEDIDEETHALVSRSMAAADATITVSGTTAEVLRTRFGVEAVVVHNAADPDVFHPAGTRFSRDRPYVMVVGWDGNEFKGMAEMRRMWQALQADRRELDLVWVTPRPPREPLGHVVVAPDQATLGAIYRGASVYVCCSHYESFALPVIEAMASGTPVVSTRNVGVLEYARDGVNALLCDVRDVDGLVSAVRRVLDEPELAGRLREGGLATAAEYSWDAIMRRVEDTYRGVCATWSAPTIDDTWQFDLRGLHFADGDAENTLRRRAAATAAARLAVPVSFPAFEGHRVVRWQVVGRRRHGGAGTTRAYVPAHANTAPRDLPYAAALRAFTAGRFDAAMAGFLDAYQRDEDDSARAALGRWMAITLLQLGRDAEANDLIKNGLEAFPGYTDYHYLQALAGLVTGRRLDGEAYVAALTLLGPATHYDEWFDAPDLLARERLLATV
ncbi:glycosyltransferase involved in cell wall biosynthesis [Krasilnikovia cinnamomea]|uniref:Glycosyltransferase involved in cell wall biosynthesis n=1 Tax=Krasilnikovia cinnamomea TaxID=349313 RepID=A0A4Q7ZIY8_9ACTN|nr:glycosyltransferase family 4 protein [Krasilnikovia cinnamomea]RZU50441.1 glycosyltransferase involved in cell wall biosynthesis [Krasilnikovia cinnamomea]